MVPDTLEPPNPLSRVAVALDTASRSTFGAWCETFGPRVGALKIGLEAFVRWGPPVVEQASSQARSVFLDLKLHDIPNTVAGAVRAAADLGVRYLTVHAGGGKKMLRAAVEAAGPRLEILAVTVLTHLDRTDLAELGLPGAPDERVASWAELARDAGCAGVVCSPLEAARLRAAHPRPFRLVTPGIRPAGAAADDQKRTMTPRSAVAAGADLLVIGRPLTGAADPRQALARLESELAGAGS